MSVSSGSLEPSADAALFAAGDGPSPHLGEVTTVHTHLIRLPLGVEESRAYWACVDPAVPMPLRAVRAFEERWFGAKSLERVRLLLSGFALRFDAYPQALATLRRWPDMDAPTRRAICHWHLQLSDPTYRAFTGEFLPRRREGAAAAVTRDVVLRWLQHVAADRWATSTTIQIATKLLSTAAEAGLIGGRRDPRRVLLPPVPDLALAYLLHLLRGVCHQGTLFDNPYLASVGLTGGLLEQRLRRLPGLAYRRMGDLIDINWHAADLAAWGELTFGARR